VARPSPARCLAAAALAAGFGVPRARANVTGAVELQGQFTQSVPRAGPSTESALLLEGLSLHYAGLPFGPSVAVATAGGSFSNVNGWSAGAATSGQVLTFDTSVGLLPRRGVPLRLYAAGTVSEGSGGALAARAAGPTLLYGGALSLEPGRVRPSLRLDVSESRGSRPGRDRFSDLQRRLAATSQGLYGGQRVTLGLRLDHQELDGAGTTDLRDATLTVASARHQTTFLASQSRRDLSALTSGISEDRQLAATSDQRWSPAVQTLLGARVADADALGATGRVMDARASASWLPLRNGRTLALSAGASVGRTRTVTAAGQRTEGDSYGANGRAGWSEPLGPVTAGLSAGAAWNTCDCGFGEGTVTTVDGTASLSSRPAVRGGWQADYTLARALAPLPRGGDRLEHHARATARLVVGAASTVHAGLGWDDAVRELLDITTGQAATLRERALTASAGGTTRLGAVALNADARNVRGRVVTGGTPFIAGGAAQVRSLWSASGGAAWSPSMSLGLQAQVVGTWADLSGAPAVTTYAANAALTYRLGRIQVGLQYQAARLRIGDDPSSLEHSVRSVLSRPFGF
jgi:hypothetical protein